MILSRRGFTLLEFLLAAGAFAALGVALAASLRSGVQSWRRSEAESRMTQRARRILEEISRELRAGLPFPGRPFEGLPEELAFFFVRDGAAGPEIVGVRYSLDEETGSLLRTETRPGGEEAPLRRVLVPERAGLAFWYPARPLRAQESLLWIDAWGKSEPPPPGVRIALTLVDERGSARTFVKTAWIPTGELR